MKRKTLCLHVNRRGVTVVERRPERGVYLEEIAPAGEVWYKIVLSSGKVGIIHLPAEVHDATDDAAILWQLLDQRNPVPRLEVQS